MGKRNDEESKKEMVQGFRIREMDREEGAELGAREMVDLESNRRLGFSQYV